MNLVHKHFCQSHFIFENGTKKTHNTYTGFNNRNKKKSNIHGMCMDILYPYFCLPRLSPNYNYS